jgi:hypothetical protein
MGIPILDAAKLAKTNKLELDELVARQDRLVKRCEAETAAQDAQRRACQDDGLAPFRDTFERIRNTDLKELSSFDRLPSGAMPDLEIENVRLSATGALGALAGGAALGAAAGAGTFAAVGALATASTGAAISGLSGAAATSATMAWLGGGSVAAGGGGVAAGSTVLAGVVAAPVVLALAGFVHWKGRQKRREQQATAAELKKVSAELRLNETRTDAVLARGAQIRQVLADLLAELTKRLPAFTSLVDNNDDYKSYGLEQRRQVADAVSLAVTIVTVLSARFVDDDGLVTDLSANAVADATMRLGALNPA